MQFRDANRNIFFPFLGGNWYKSKEEEFHGVHLYFSSLIDCNSWEHLRNQRIGMDLKLSRLEHEAITIEAPASTSPNPHPPPGSGHQQKALKQNIHVN